jgi:hypothetical protein
MINLLQNIRKSRSAAMNHRALPMVRLLRGFNIGSALGDFSERSQIAQDIRERIKVPAKPNGGGAMAQEPVETADGRPRRAWLYFGTAAVVLSMFAVAIVVGNVAAGVPRQADENASAHLFQLAVAAQPPLLLLFLATADWRQRQRVIILLGAQIAAVALALLALGWSGY